MTDSFGLQQRSVEAENLGCDFILEVGRSENDDKRKGALANFAHGSRNDNPDKAARSAVPQGGIYSPYDRVEADMLNSEDWEVALDALLEDISTDLA